ncbi:hypothetical protein RHA1_ro06677 [Rhodococcus jostii RHA1]|uniref:Uncharacterized protein n=1 Tax=Rhodococcus jostii (strain RHA1) TaxID=101510 RepID=Q0S1Y6_RHOJR|nr:hypothetical protein RHA1_ro06677 [Rhodococcus jostii RHA1]
MSGARVCRRDRSSMPWSPIRPFTGISVELCDRSIYLYCWTGLFGAGQSRRLQNRAARSTIYAAHLLDLARFRRGSTSLGKRVLSAGCLGTSDRLPKLL